jgi:hypothetical protein
MTNFTPYQRRHSISEYHRICLIVSLPSSSESDQHDTSSQDGDDDMSNVSADSFAISSNCVSSTSISNSKSEAATDIVDALYELPTQGEWEQLILPKAYFVRSGNVDLILAVPAST